MAVLMMVVSDTIKELSVPKDSWGAFVASHLHEFRPSIAQWLHVRRCSFGATTGSGSSRIFRICRGGCRAKGSSGPKDGDNMHRKPCIVSQERSEVRTVTVPGDEADTRRTENANSHFIYNGLMTLI